MSTNNSWNNQIASANSEITLNSGTNTINISSDAANTTCNFATGAGVKLVQLGSTNTTSSLALRYGTCDFTLASATGTAISALDTGETTKPLQPAFLAYTSSDANNVTGDGTYYTLILDTEIFDQNSDYSTVTGTFTAPVTGKYIVNGDVRYNAGAATICDLLVVTSNRNYFPASMNPASNLGVGGYFYASGGCLADMDIGDIANLVGDVWGTTKTADIMAGASFSASLIC